MNTQTHLIDPSLHDFTDAKVGDKIYSLQYGEGVITSVANSEDYPIEAGFSSHSATFTKHGKHRVHLYPTAFRVPIKIVPADAKIFEEREMMVWDNDIKEALKRVVFYECFGVFCAYSNDRTNFITWKYALPIHEWEAKVRESKNAARIKELEDEIAARQSELNQLKSK